MKIRSKLARVKVDNYPALYDLGYRKNGDFIDDIADKGRESVMSSIARYSKDGDRLMDFKNNDIVDIIQEETAVKQVEPVLKYKRGPDIEVKSAELNIDYKPQEPVINSKMRTVLNTPLIKFNRGKVDVKMLQYARMEIYVRGNTVNESV